MTNFLGLERRIILMAFYVHIIVVEFVDGGNRYD